LESRTHEWPSLVIRIAVTSPSVRSVVPSVA